MSKGSGTIFIQEERLQISEAGRKQNESIWNRVFKSVARFSTQYRVKESFQFLFAILKFGGINHATAKEQKTEL